MNACVGSSGTSALNCTSARLKAPLGPPSAAPTPCASLTSISSSTFADPDPTFAKNDVEIADVSTASISVTPLLVSVTKSVASPLPRSLAKSRMSSATSILISPSATSDPVKKDVATALVRPVTAVLSAAVERKPCAPSAPAVATSVLPAASASEITGSNDGGLLALRTSAMPCAKATAIVSNCVLTNPMG